MLPFEPGETWLKVKVSAPPEDGKANKAIIALLAKLLSVPKTSISIVSGKTTRYKRLTVETEEPEALLETLASTLGNPDLSCFEIKR